MNNYELLKDRNNRIKLYEFIKEDLINLKLSIIYILKIVIKIIIFAAISELAFYLLFLAISHIPFSTNYKDKYEAAAPLIAFFLTLFIITTGTLTFIRLKEHINKLKKD